MPDAPILEVRLHDQLIGTVTHLPGDQSLFAFTEDYIGNPNRPTLSLSFKDTLGGLLSDFRPTRRRLTPFFSNLLPEGALRQYLARRAGVHVDREFFLLQVLGRDLPGAVSIVPVGSEIVPSDIDGVLERGEALEDQAMRFSLAGVQLKFSALTDTSKKGGLVIPTQGVGGEWIVKLPDPRLQGIPENEYSMMTLARSVGIDVPEIRLLDVGEIGGLPEGVGHLQGQAYAVRRFDRSEQGRVHIEDFAQVFDRYPEKKYELATIRRIAQVLGTEDGDRSVTELIRRVTFSVLIGNGDMHLKNWSLIYPDRRWPQLSPAYDLVSTVPYISDESFALKFVRTRAFSGYTEDELQELARRAQLPAQLLVTTARDTVTRFLDEWAARKRELPLDAQVAGVIDRHLNTLPIVRRGR